MKAWQFSSTAGGLEANLQLNGKAVPPPAELSPEEVFIEVISMSLNPVDYKVAELPVVGRFAISKPASPGLDYCGRVIGTGSAVDVRPGQIVFGKLDGLSKFGSLAECIVAKRAGAVPLPDGVDPDDAAAIGTAGLTAYQSIVPYVKAGDKVFINGGSGGTGTFGVQIAKAVGCHVTTSCSTRNIQLCMDLGADEVIDYKSTDLVKELRAKAQGFSLIVDNVGSPYGLYEDSHHYLKEGGRYVQVGVANSLSGLYSLFTRSLWPSFLGGGRRPFSFILVVNKYNDFAQIAQWMKEGKVRAVIDTVFEFEEGNKSFEILKSGRARGKIVVRVTKRP